MKIENWQDSILGVAVAPGSAVTLPDVVRTESILNWKEALDRPYAILSRVP